MADVNEMLITLRQSDGMALDSLATVFARRAAEKPAPVQRVHREPPPVQRSLPFGGGVTALNQRNLQETMDPAGFAAKVSGTLETRHLIDMIV